MAVSQLCLVKRVTGLCNLCSYITGHLKWLIGVVVYVLMVKSRVLVCVSGSRNLVHEQEAGTSWACLITNEGVFSDIRNSAVRNKDTTVLYDQHMSQH